MKSLTLLVLGVLVMATTAGAREFTVLVYNVENFFDIDGVAAFDDYDQHNNLSTHPYSPEKLLTKLTNLTKVLQLVNEGEGPEIILFQEFELDRTQDNPIKDLNEWVRSQEDIPLETMLRGPISAETANLPIEAWVLKALYDGGMRGYQVAHPDPTVSLVQTPHRNVVFSKFPITTVRQFDKRDARDLLEVIVEIDGQPLYLLNNHWKSGASNPDLEVIRLENAAVVRERVDAILKENPQADIIVGGDLNSHYNQILAVPGLTRTGVNTVLRSTGDLPGVLAGSGELFNLWFELPIEERGSEVFRGRWGTLMQMLLSAGLWDDSGIQYVEGSFFRLAKPGLNFDAMFGEPIRWSSFGAGSGFSDHLPIGARFRVVEDVNSGNRDSTSTQPPTPHEMTDYLHPVDYNLPNDFKPQPVPEWAMWDNKKMTPLLGNLYEVNAVVISVRPLLIEVGGRTFGVFSDDAKILANLRDSHDGQKLQFVGQLASWRGNLQFLVQHSSWLHW